MGTFAPAGTPRPVAEKLNAELKKAVADPEVASNLNAQSIDPMHMTLDEFAKQMKADYDKFAHVVRLSGARLDYGSPPALIPPCGAPVPPSGARALRTSRLL